MLDFRKHIHKLDSNTAVDIPVEYIMCGDNINFSGSSGVFIFDIELGEELGTTTMDYQAYDYPDRFQIYYGGVMVADSRYVGDLLTGNPPDLPTGFIGNVYYSVPEYVYNGSTFVPNSNVRDITITTNDVADGSTYPSSGTGTLSFNKLSSVSGTKATVYVYAPLGNTQWATNSYCPIGTGYKSILLGPGPTAVEACNKYNNPSTHYIPTADTFETTNEISFDSMGNTVPSANWFSNGTIARYWDGTTFTTQVNC